MCTRRNLETVDEQNNQRLTLENLRTERLLDLHDDTETHALAILCLLERANNTTPSIRYPRS